MVETSTAPAGKLNVFISYSRDDLNFADQLDATLKIGGFEPTLDRHGIHGGENWQAKLGNLIREADTIVFVLSPASAQSEICAWEVDEAVRLGKRILPVLCMPLAGIPAPKPLAALNYIHFYPEPDKPGSGFRSGLLDLVEALKTDLEWLREHTRLLQKATEWEAGGRKADRLLFGGDIAAAKIWAARHPPDAPALTTLHLDFIRESEIEGERRHNEERQRLEQMQAAQSERARALEAAEAAQTERAKALAAAETAQADQARALAREAEASQREAEASRRAAEESQRAALQSRRVAQRTLAGLALALAFAIVAVYFWFDATNQRKAALDSATLANHEAEKAKQEAKRTMVQASRYLAALATSELKDNDPATALALGLEAFKGEGPALNDIAEDIRAEGAIYQSLIELKEIASLSMAEAKPVQGLEYAAHSPTGEYIVTVGSSEARIWDTKRKARLEPALPISTTETVDPRSSTISVPIYAEFSPNDGKLLLTVDNDGIAKVWNVSDRSLLLHLPETAFRAAFAGNGTQVVTVAIDQRSVVVWKIDGSLVLRTKERAEGEQNFDRVLAGLAGKRLVTIDVSGQVETWSAAPATTPISPDSGTPLPAVSNNPNSTNTSNRPLADLSPDENRLALVTREGSFEIWDLDQRRISESRPERGITDIAFAPTGRRLALATREGEKLISLDSEQVAHTALADGRESTVRVDGVTFSPDGRYLAALTNDRTIRISDTHAKQPERPAIVRGEFPWNLRGLFSKDGQLIARRRGNAREIGIFDAKPVGPTTRLAGSEGISTGLSFVNGGKTLVYGVESGSVKLWNVREQKAAAELTGVSTAAIGLAVSATGDRLFVIRQNGDGELWRLSDGGGHRLKSIPNILAQSKELTEAASDRRNRPAIHFAPVGQVVAVSFADGVALWNTESGERLVLLENAKIMGASSFSHDGRKIAFLKEVQDAEQSSNRAGSNTRAKQKYAISVFDLTDGRSIQLFETEHEVIPTFSGSQNELLATNGNRILLWDDREKRIQLDWNPDDDQQTEVSDDILRRFILSVRNSTMSSSEGFDVHLPTSGTGMGRIAVPDGSGVRIFDGKGWANAVQRRVSDVDKYATLASLQPAVDVEGIAFGDNGRLIAIAGAREPVQIWRTYTSTQDLVEHARQVVPRCLTREQRIEQYLEEEPPDWCITLGKWPYHAPEWKLWLAGGKRDPMPKGLAK